jgi:hypothetical protein
MTCRPAGLAHQGLLPSCRDRVLFFPDDRDGGGEALPGHPCRLSRGGAECAEAGNAGDDGIGEACLPRRLGRTGVHRNQGAQATLVFVATMLHLAGMPKPALRPPGETHGETQAAAAKASRR